MLTGETIIKSYGNKKILGGIYIKAAAGRITAIIGRNGSGKSTLLNILSGNLSMDSGSIFIKGQIVKKVTPVKIAAEGVFYLSQNNLLLNNMKLGKQLQSVQKIFQSDAIYQETVNSLKLTHVLFNNYHDLSGGEKKRSDLAAAFLRKPGILLLDEPFTGLAPLDISDIKNSLRNFTNDGGAILITDHLFKEVFDLADSFYYLYDGYCIFFQTKTELMNNTHFQKNYLVNTYN